MLVLLRVVSLKLLELAAQLFQHAGVAHRVPGQIRLDSSSEQASLPSAFNWRACSTKGLVLGVGKGNLGGHMVPRTPRCG